MILLDFGLKFEREILGRIGFGFKRKEEEEVLLVISEEEQNLGR